MNDSFNLWYDLRFIYIISDYTHLWLKLLNKKKNASLRALNLKYLKLHRQKSLIYEFDMIQFKHLFQHWVYRENIIWQQKLWFSCVDVITLSLPYLCLKYSSDSQKYASELIGIENKTFSQFMSPPCYLFIKFQLQRFEEPSLSKDGSLSDIEKIK